DDVRLHLVDLLPRPPGLVEARRFGRAGADGVHADLAVPQLRRPAARERPHGRLAGAVDAARVSPLIDATEAFRMIDPPVVQSGTWTLMAKSLSKCSSPIDPSGANARKPALANRTSRRPCWRVTAANSLSRSPRFATSPRTPVTLFPISLTAAVSSGSRRPV